MEIHIGKPDLSAGQAYTSAKQLVVDTDKAILQKFGNIKTNFLKEKKKEALTVGEHSS